MPARLLSVFARREDGAVTVDWVVLTAAIMGMSLAVIAIWWDALTTNVGFLNRTLDERTISTTFDAPAPAPAPVAEIDG